MDTTPNEDSSLLNDQPQGSNDGVFLVHRRAQPLDAMTEVEKQLKKSGRLASYRSKRISFWYIFAIIFIMVSLVTIIVLFVRQRSPFWWEKNEHEQETVAIAFVGNSMFYVNDFPRFFQVFSSAGGNNNKNKRVVVQNSCLRGEATIPSLILEGNGMYPQFQTSQALLDPSSLSESSSEKRLGGRRHRLYDYGACTVKQLLTGQDSQLDHPHYSTSTVVVPDNHHQQSTSNFNFNSGTVPINQNPCRIDMEYLDYAKEYFQYQQPVQPYWNFIMMNDHTHHIVQTSTRKLGLQTLEESYVPWFLKTKATPVLLWAHAYSLELSTVSNRRRGMEEDDDDNIANITTLTGKGYEEYATLLASHLPSKQAPRIAPVALAFLLIHDENRTLWKTLFHSDHIHASPSGTFLQGCIVYYTLFDEMPSKDWVVRPTMSSLWKTARMMQPAWEPPYPIPDVEIAEYLYRVAERIMVEGEAPPSFS